MRRRAVRGVGAAGVARDDASPAFVAARIVGGLAVGAAILIAPVYIAEIAPARRRGGLVSLNQLMIVIGISASFFSNYFLLDVGEHNWRWMLGVQMFPALLYLLLLSLIPESPRWLVIKGRDEEALEVLTRVYGAAQAQESLQQIRAESRSEERLARLARLVRPAHSLRHADRARTRLLPADHRHQRDLLLPADDLRAGRRRRQRRVPPGRDRRPGQRRS